MEKSQFPLLGTSSVMVDLRRKISKVHLSSANVLIYGETGTGKELVARQLRRTHTDGKYEPFIAIDSSTIQSSIAESILFGHTKGAFTGAGESTSGIFEDAHQGVVYFDEISNMPLEIQPKLLRVLQEKEVKRLGSTRTIPLQFRVICASNRDLEQMSAEGLFKADLLQRLNVISIYVPALRERAEDIPLLIDHFLQKEPRSVPITLSSDATEALCTYCWPGNVRELENVIAYTVLMLEGDEIGVGDLPEKIRLELSGSERCSFYNRVRQYERELLTQVTKSHTGTTVELARSLRMDRSHLHKKLKEYGLNKEKTYLKRSF